MNWRNAKHLAALMLLLSVGCGSRYDPFDPGGKEKDRKETREQEMNLLYNLYLNYLECQKPGAINFDGGCISVTTTEAIYDHGTGLPLHATTAAASAQLECRDPGRTGVGAAGGNAWYKTSIASPPAGYRAIWVGSQPVQTDGSGNVVAVYPMSPIASGDHLYCVVYRNDIRIAYQAIEIL